MEARHAVGSVISWMLARFVALWDALGETKASRAPVRSLPPRGDEMRRTALVVLLLVVAAAVATAGRRWPSLPHRPRH